jgi:hypothetical protein
MAAVASFFGGASAATRVGRMAGTVASSESLPASADAERTSDGTGARNSIHVRRRRASMSSAHEERASDIEAARESARLHQLPEVPSGGPRTSQVQTSRVRVLGDVQDDDDIEDEVRAAGERLTACFPSHLPIANGSS